MSEKKESVECLSEIILKPVGIVKNEIKKPILTAGSDDIKMDEEDAAESRKKMSDSRNKVSEVIINENLEGILDGIEDFSHILILFWAHLVPEERRRSLVKVHPMGRKDLPLVGIFSTCSPVRPNSVLATVVQLIERKGNILRVTGLDAVDGSPVIDVKPFSSWFYPSEEEIKTSEWMKQLQREFSS